MTGRLDTKWFSCGFCTERGKVVRRNGLNTLWFTFGIQPGKPRTHGLGTTFPWGRAVKRLKESLLSRAERARLRRD